MACRLEIATARGVGSRAPRLCPGATLRRFALSFAVLASMTCSGLLGSQFVWGQDDWDAVKEPANPAAAVGFGGRFQLPEFNQWVFRGKTPAQVEQMLMSKATVRLDSVELTYELSEAQRKKLELAARGDVKRFLRQANEVRDKFGKVRNNQQEFHNVIQAVQPLQARMNGSFFDDKSLLEKVLRSALSGEQSGKYKQQQLERRRFNYEAKIELSLVMLETGIPLREQQRQRIVKLLLDETEAPKQFGQQGYYAVLYQASKLEEEKLRPIFDDAQWRAIKKLLAQGKAMESHLKSNGFIP